MSRLISTATQVVTRGISFIGRQPRDWRVTVVRSSLDRMTTQMIIPYQSLYVMALGATATQLGAFNSIGMLLTAFLGPFTGWTIDRIGAKKIYLAGIFFQLISYLTFSMAQDWLLAMVAMVAYWLGFSTSILSCATICGNCLARRDRATGMMICETMAAGLLGMAGPIIGAWVVASSGGLSVSGIRPVYALSLAITTVSFFLVLTQLSDHRWSSLTAKPWGMLGDLHRVLREGRNLKRWLVIASVGHLPVAVVLPFFPLYAHDVKGADAILLGAMVTACALTSIVFAIPMGRMADIVGRKKALYIGIPLFWISNLLLVFAPGPEVLIVVGILQGFHYISGPIGAALERELVPADQMGRWLGINRLVRGTLNASMALAAGLIWDRIGPQYVFLFFVFLDATIRMPLLIGLPETLRQRIREQPGS